MHYGPIQKMHFDVFWKENQQFNKLDNFICDEYCSSNLESTKAFFFVG